MEDEGMLYHNGEKLTKEKLQLLLDQSLASLRIETILAY